MTHVTSIQALVAWWNRERGIQIDWKKINKAIEYFEHTRQRKSSAIEMPGILTMMFDGYYWASVGRILYLVNSIRTNLESESWLEAAILGRCLLESYAMLDHDCDRIAYKTKSASVGEIIKLLDSITMGTKLIPTDIEESNIRNVEHVMNAVRSYGKQIGYEIMIYYNEACEIVHPAPMGTFHLFRRERQRIKDDRLSDTEFIYEPDTKKLKRVGCRALEVLGVVMLSVPKLEQSYSAISAVLTPLDNKLVLQTRASNRTPPELEEFFQAEGKWRARFSAYCER